MFLDPNDGGVGQRLCAMGKREMCYMYLLRKFAHGVAYDVGANIGYCTMSLARKCDLVRAFEPSEENHKTLLRNLKYVSNAIPYYYAIGNISGLTKFYLTDKPNLHTVINTGEGKEVDVNMVRIDDVMGLPPNFIKMDIEGGEVGALQGAEKTLTDAKDMTILIEVHPEKYSAENDFERVLRHIVFDLGYNIEYVINAKGKRDIVAAHCKLYKDGLEEKRAIFTDIPQEHAIGWTTQMPEDGLKIVRAIMLIRTKR